jgi:low affinity Fe/Cu permease
MPGLEPMPEKRTADEKKNRFARFAKRTAEVAGSPWAFIAAIVVTVGWLVTGPIFHYSDSWQLIINSITNIATFLVVFVIQNSQNRDARALHLKLDEVIRAIVGAHNEMIDIENLSDDQLKTLERQYEAIRAESHRRHNKEEAA